MSQHGDVTTVYVQQVWLSLNLFFPFVKVGWPVPRSSRHPVMRLPVMQPLPPSVYSVYLGRQRGEGVPDEKNVFCACVLHFEPWVVDLLLHECSKLQCLGQKLQDKRHEARSFNGTPSNSIYLSRHWHYSHDIMDQAFPLCFCILQVIKIWTVGRTGNEAKGWASLTLHKDKLHVRGSSW